TDGTDSSAVTASACDPAPRCPTRCPGRCRAAGTGRPATGRPVTRRSVTGRPVTGDSGTHAGFEVRMDATLARVLALTLVSALSGIVLVLAIGGTKPDGPEYTAVFTDSSGMIVNSDVRAAGIVVGEVRSVDVRPDNLVEVVFTAEESTPMTTSTQARIRYKNVVGDRFLELLPGPGPSRPLPPHGVIPVERTRPALDLDELYNGFAPLF